MVTIVSARSLDLSVTVHRNLRKYKALSRKMKRIGVWNAEGQFITAYYVGK